MLRLYRESSRSYPGRSVRLGHGVHGEANDQSGHWGIKPGRMGIAALPCERTRQQAARHTWRVKEQSLT
jgi:hypothetical protein